MNGVRTYRSEDQLNSEKSKRILCPNCNTTGYTIVKKECDCGIILAVLFFPPLILCFFMSNDFDKKEVHYCRYCNHDCTDVKSLDENNCNII